MFKQSNIIPLYLAKTLVGTGVPPLIVEQNDEEHFYESSEEEENDDSREQHDYPSRSHSDLPHPLHVNASENNSECKSDNVLPTSNNDSPDATLTTRAANGEAGSDVSLLEQLDVCTPNSRWKVISPNSPSSPTTRHRHIHFSLQRPNSPHLHPNSAIISEEKMRRNSIISMPDDNEDIVTDLVSHIKAKQGVNDVRRCSIAAFDQYQQYQKRNHSLADGALLGAAHEGNLSSLKELYRKKVNRSISVDMSTTRFTQPFVRDITDESFKSLPATGYVPVTTQVPSSNSPSLPTNLSLRRQSLTSSASSPALGSLSPASVNTSPDVTSSLPAQPSSTPAATGLQPLPQLPRVIQDLPSRNMRDPTLSSAKAVAKPVSPSEKVLAKRKEGIKKLESNLLAPVSF